MPVDPNAEIEVVAFEWVPPVARGRVRDLRVRWALEEVGLCYRTKLISAMKRPDWYFKVQPFGQVPAYHEGDVHLFECGAIALHIAEKDERLLPRDPAGRGRAITWLISALNSVDPMQQFCNVMFFHGRGMEWPNEARPVVDGLIKRRLELLAEALGDKEWLEGRFTVGDLMMVATLRDIDRERIPFPPSLAAYVARGEARPAFQAALAAQLADFIPDEEGVPA